MGQTERLGQKLYVSFLLTLAGVAGAQEPIFTTVGVRDSSHSVASNHQDFQSITEEAKVLVERRGRRAVVYSLHELVRGCDSGPPRGSRAVKTGVTLAG